MACIVMLYIVMAYVVMADVATANTAYVVMAAAAELLDVVVLLPAI